MMRLPRFRFLSPRTVQQAARMLADEGPQAMLVAGGTDLLPNMKRRHQVPRTLISLRRVEEMRAIDNGTGLALGAGNTLTGLVRDERVRDGYGALWQAAAQVATPHLRNMGTLGGNICLDTRCTYYNQNYEWRQAIDFCMKKDGGTCWVAPSSKRCLAVSSTDTAPALIALGAEVQLVSTEGERSVPLRQLYNNDGIEYISRRPDEILTRVVLPSADGWRSAYWKLRRRGSFDFPVLSAAAALERDDSGRILSARIVLGAVASQPMVCDAAARHLEGRHPDDATIEEAAELASKLAKPMDNTDFTLHWRKRIAREFVALALREARGDAVRRERLRYARHDLAAAGV